VFDALDTIKPALDVSAKLWPRIKFDGDAMRAAAGGFALATDLAEYLVERGIPFREAHEIVGSLVRDTIAAGKLLSDLSLEDFRRHSPHFDTDVLEMLAPENSIKVRSVIGGPAPGMVRERIQRLRG
jgi:argininosuccinate lyase